MVVVVVVVVVVEVVVVKPSPGGNFIKRLYICENVDLVG